MAHLWGRYEKDDEPETTKELIPSEIVKFFIMQAMQQDPYRTPPPSEKNAEKPSELDVLTNETLGLETDDRVIHSLKLIQHAKEMRQLIEAAKDQTDVLSESQIPPVIDIPDHPVPPLKYGLNYPLQYMDKQFSDFTNGQGVELPSITETTTKKLLSKSVAALLAHAGFDKTTESVLATVADATETYIKKMVTLLRVAVDQGANVGATGFPDAMERVFTEMRIGSVRELHDFYQKRVIKRHQVLLEECQNLNLEYCSLAVNVKSDTLNLTAITKLEEPDDVPEIHFPAMGDDGVDELQPSLEPGFQMLHSLEQLQQMDSQDDGATGNDSPGQDGYDVHAQLSRKRKRI